MQKVTIATHVGKLTGTLVAAKKPTGKAILFIHGWDSREDGYIPRAQALADIGYTGLTFNLPGHSTSDGDMKKLTRREYLAGVVAAYDYLKKQKGIDPTKIGIVGASFGAYLGALLTKERPVRWLVLRAPATYKDKGFDNEPQLTYRYENPDMVIWREKAFKHNEINSLQTVYDFPHEILLVEGGIDTIVPHQSVVNYANAVFNKAKLTHVVIRGADHQLSKEKFKSEFIKIMVKWFKNWT